MTTKTADPEVIFDNDEMDFLNWDAPADLLDDDGYRYIQWNNNLGGKWEFPLKYWAGTLIAEKYGPPVDIEHGLETITVEAGTLADELNVSFVARRTAWERWVDGERILSPTYEPGMSKRYHFLVVIKEAEAVEVAIITTRSWTGDYLTQAVRAHRQTVLAQASRLSGGRKFPAFMFWATLTGGNAVIVGSKKQSKIHPPVIVSHDTDDLPGLLKELYVGDEIRDFIAANLDQGYRDWSEQWGPTYLLPAPGNSAVENILLVAEIESDGSITPVDLSQNKKGDWMRWAYSTELFGDEGDTDAAYSQLMKRAKIKATCKDDADRWWAWYGHVNELSQAKAEAAEALKLRA